MENTTTRFKGQRWYRTLMKAVHCYWDWGCALRIDCLSVCTSNLETSTGESSWLLTLCFCLFCLSTHAVVSHTHSLPRLDLVSLMIHGTQTLAQVQSVKVRYSEVCGVMMVVLLLRRTVNTPVMMWGNVCRVIGLNRFYSLICYSQEYVYMFVYLLYF